MRLSKWLVGAVSTLSLLGMSSGVAMAATQSETRVSALPQKQLVALGDSISYGYNLGPNNNQPSTYAFPYLIGEATNEKVQDLSVPGATSSDLLNLLQTSPQVDAAVRGASTVTIDIGSNDLLQIASADGLLSPSPPVLTTAEQNQFAAAIQKFSANLPRILAIVHQFAPKANVVLYNLYDPFSSQTAPALHALAEQMIAPENQIITAVATQAGLPVVDAYSLFDNRQAYLVLPGDVHPTILGQAVLAIVGYGVLLKEECTKPCPQGHRGFESHPLRQKR